MAKEHPELALLCNDKSRLLLHIAGKVGTSAETMQVLLAAAPEAAAEQDTED